MCTTHALPSTTLTITIQDNSIDPTHVRTSGHLTCLFPSSLSSVQRLLPKQAPRITICVKQIRDCRSIQVNLRRPSAIHREFWYARSAGYAVDHKARYILLQRHSNGVIRHRGVWAIEEGVRHILAVQRWPNRELIGIGVVVEGTVEVVSVAGERDVGGEENGALEIRGVAVRAVEDGRVEHVFNVGEDGG